MTIAEIISIEPLVGGILSEATVRRDCAEKEVEYSTLKIALTQLVGWEAENKSLRTNAAYVVAHKALLDALDF